MASARTRSLVKGIIWELSAPFILYIFIQEWKVVVGYMLARMVLYYFYERLWKKLKWGKHQ